MKFSNGKSYPEKKFFSNESYDPETRMFKGTIDWAPFTTKSGDSSLEYTLYFDEAFTKIIEGSTKIAKDEDEDDEYTYYYETDMFYKRKF
jgi:hypothetical protein